MNIDIETVRGIDKFRRQINSLSVQEVADRLRKGGEPVDITQKAVEDWEFTGLNNWDFIMMEGYKGLKAEDEI